MKHFLPLLVLFLPLTVLGQESNTPDNAARVKVREASVNRAVAAFPAINDANSPEGREFGRLYEAYKKAADPILWNDNCAYLIALQTMDNLSKTREKTPVSTSRVVATDDFNATVAASKARMEAKYPQLNQMNSPLYAKVVATAHAWRTSDPNFFKNPNWPEPLVEACVADVVKNPTLYTARDVMAYWEKQLPSVPSAMDSEYYPIKRQREQFYEAVRTGELNGKAQDDADALNIPLLAAAGKSADVAALQRSRANYQQKLVDAAAAADRQQQLAQQRAADVAQLQEMRNQTSAIEQHQADVQNLQNQMSQLQMQNPQPGGSVISW